MREFSKISPAVWGSERFNNLPSDDARFLYLFLLTCEHQTSAGAFKLKDGYAVDDLRWTIGRYQAARQHLVDADLVSFDEPSRVVLIKRWFRHNPPMNESHLQGVAKIIHKLPCEPLKMEALAALHQAFEELQVSKAMADAKLPPAPVTDLSQAMRAHASKNGFTVAQGGRT
jgi:hypothetical protein